MIIRILVLIYAVTAAVFVILCNGTVVVQEKKKKSFLLKHFLVILGSQKVNFIFAQGQPKNDHSPHVYLNLWSTKVRDDEGELKPHSK